MYIYIYIILYHIVSYPVPNQVSPPEIGNFVSKSPDLGELGRFPSQEMMCAYFQLDIAGPMDDCLRKIIVIDPDNSRYIQMSGWYFQTWPRRCRLKLNMLRTWVNELRYLMIVPLVAHDYYYTWLIPDYTIYYILILGSSTLMVTCSDSAILRVTYSLVVAGTALVSPLK